MLHACPAASLLLLSLHAFILPGLVKAVADVAEFVQADWQDVVPVVNATSAVNAVVQSLQLKRGDLLLMSSTTYPAVRGLWHRTVPSAAATLAGGLDCWLLGRFGDSLLCRFLAAHDRAAGTTSRDCSSTAAIAVLLITESRLHYELPGRRCDEASIG